MTTGRINQVARPYGPAGSAAPGTLQTHDGLTTMATEPTVTFPKGLFLRHVAPKGHDPIT